MAEKKRQAVPTTLEPVFQVWGWTLLIWSLYRYFFKLPEWADEYIFKPIVFLGPMLWYLKRVEKTWGAKLLGSLGFTANKLYVSMYVGLGFGVLFAIEGVIANAIKYGTFNINPIEALKAYGLFPLLFISLATSIWEETFNRGFLFNRIYQKTKNLPYASVISSILFVLLHVPILVASLKFQGMTLVLFFLTNFVLGIINSVLYAYLGSIAAPILVHLFWNMTVALFL